MRIRIMSVALLAAGLSGCAAVDAGSNSKAPRRTATAQLQTATGQEIGQASVREEKDGLRMTLEVHGLPAGVHGAHIHAIGKCEAPGFASAAGHWNPTASQHGAHNPAGPHRGDLPNLIVGADGRGTLGVLVPAAVFDEMLDADGATMIVHAAADDLATDPSGNSGARLACGVFVQG